MDVRFELWRKLNAQELMLLNCGVGTLYAYSAVLCLVGQLCPTLCNPMDCSAPGFSVCGILQARILEWVAMPSSRGSSQPRDRTQGSHTAGRFFTVWSTRELPTFGNSLEISDYICAQLVEQCIKITFWNTHTLQWGQNNSDQFLLTGVSKGLIRELLLDQS